MVIDADAAAVTGLPKAEDAPESLIWAADRDAGMARH
jgi:hypothetical protein